MLVTHSEPRKGETSHICDISLLRVKRQTFQQLLTVFFSVQQTK